VPIASQLLKPLTAQIERSRGDFVFVKQDGRSPYRSIRTAFETACRHAKLIDVTPHVLRHTFASRLVMNGAPLRTVQDLGGWKSLSMVVRYSHLSDTHRLEAVELIGRRQNNFTTGITTRKNSAIGQFPEAVEK